MMPNEYINFGQPFIGEEDIAEVVDTLKSGWLTTGPKTAQFEKEFAEYIGVKHAIGVSSCTAGLFLIQRALGLTENDAVITTPLTFVATPNSIRHTGATPLFVDVDNRTGLITPEAVERFILTDCKQSNNLIHKATGKIVKALLPVHLFGQPVDVDWFQSIANKYNLILIDDAAHAIESTFRDRKIGAATKATAFSFYSSKSICAGEGGMVTTNDSLLADRIRVMRLHGLNKDAWTRSSIFGYQHYLATELGWKFNLIDLHSALAIHQLRRVPVMYEKRKIQWTNYCDSLKNIPGILLPEKEEEYDNSHAYHLFTIRVQWNCSLRRDVLISELHQRGIGTGVHYPSMSQHPAYKGLMNIATPMADRIGNEIISLPLGGALTNAQQDRIITELKNLLNA